MYIKLLKPFNKFAIRVSSSPKEERLRGGFKLDKILLLLSIITYQTGYGLAWYILLYSTVCVIRVVKMWTHEVQPKGFSENT